MKKYYLFSNTLVTLVWVDDEQDPHKVAAETGDGTVIETTFDKLTLADYYRAKAAKRFKVPYSEVTDVQRRFIKAHSFVDNYGTSGMFESAGVSEKILTGKHIKEPSMFVVPEGTPKLFVAEASSSTIEKGGKSDV